MSSLPIYSIDYSKYKNIKCYSQCLGLDREILRKFHTCDSLMERKKKLEKLVRRKSNNIMLKKHFRTKFQDRKLSFYRKVVYELRPESEIEHQILNLTKDILFIYDKKKEELEYIDELSNHYEAYESHEQEMRESMIEDWRNCD